MPHVKFQNTVCVLIDRHFLPQIRHFNILFFNKPGQSKILQTWMTLLLNKIRHKLSGFHSRGQYCSLLSLGLPSHPTSCHVSHVFVLDIFNEPTVAFTYIVFLWHIFHNHFIQSMDCRIQLILINVIRLRQFIEIPLRSTLLPKVRLVCFLSLSVLVLPCLIGSNPVHLKI